MSSYRSVVIDSNFIYSTLGFTPPVENVVYRSFRIANSPPFSNRFRSSDQNAAVFVIAYENYTLVEATQDQTEYLSQIAITNGSTLLITNRQIKNYPSLVVPNVIKALYMVLDAFQRDFKPPTIAITGSIGKTTTKNFVNCLLEDSFPKARGNANDIRGVINSICHSNVSCNYLVTEVMEGPPPGTSKIISEIIKPNVAIITQTSNSHIGYFESIEHIFESSLEIQSGMPDDGILFLNGDDVYQKNPHTKLKTMYYAIDNQDADFSATNIEISKEGTSFDFVYRDEVTRMHTNYLGKHNVYNVLSAIAVGKWLGISNETIKKRLLSEKATGIRQNIFHHNSYTIYIDCFNASEDSMISALDVFQSLNNENKKIAVLGSMAELGEHAQKSHEKVGEYITQVELDILLCFGQDATYIAEKSKQNKKLKIFHSNDKSEICGFLKDVLEIGDMILFKGSRAMKLEEICDKVFGTAFVEELTKPL